MVLLYLAYLFSACPGSTFSLYVRIIYRDSEDETWNIIGVVLAMSVELIRYYPRLYLNMGVRSQHCRNGRRNHLRLHARNVQDAPAPYSGRWTPTRVGFVAYQSEREYLRRQSP